VYNGLFAPNVECTLSIGHAIWACKKDTHSKH
jgi:hypothetical protein